jgi:hypothetical protein
MCEIQMFTQKVHVSILTLFALNSNFFLLWNIDM